ncbi:MAG TPA: hypothetical protein ENL35_07780 [Chloroflexi bacterium]|nr:hypothetical protein [Chloroflexota bacterium]
MNNPDYFPFERWGLRGNPFQALTREEWAEVALLPSEVETALRQNPDTQALQILGESGAGKTSTLLALWREAQGQARACSYEYIPPGSRRYHTRLDSLQLFLLDEAQRIHPRRLRRLFQWLRKAPATGLRLIWSSHADLTPLARAAGIETHSVSLDQAPRADLQRMLDRRLRFFALPGGPKLRLDPSATAFLAARFGRDLGGMERFLYEFFQLALSSPCIDGGTLEDFAARINATPER